MRSSRWRRALAVPALALGVTGALTSAAASAPAAPSTIWLEAEHPATVTPPMQPYPDAGASNGRYLSVPNGTGDNGAATYSFSVTTAGTYYVWGRALSPSNADNTFVLEVDSTGRKTWTLPVGAAWTWNRIADKKGPYKFTLAAGTHTLKLTQGKDGTRLDKVLVVNDAAYIPTGTGAPASNVPETFGFEAEGAAAITTPFEIASDPTATAGAFLVVPDGTGNSTGDDGTASYEFTVSKTANFTVWGRTWGDSDNNDSFFVRVDGGPLAYWSVRRSDHGWKWDQLSDRNTTPWSDPVVLTLQPGPHVITVGWREDGTKLDRLVVTSDATLHPGLTDRFEQVNTIWSGAFTQPDLLVESDRQFVAYYSGARWLTIAARRLGTDQWTFKPVDYQYDGWDTHRDIVIAADRLGYLHVVAGQHSDALKYWVSTRAWDITSLTRVSCMVCGDPARESQVTYPRFVTGPAGEFLFLYRQGASGSGHFYLDVFDPTTRTWAPYVTEPVLSHPADRPMSAYPSDLVRDANGVYHLAWMWRDTADVLTNHTVAYARSADLVHWTRSDGTPLSLPITIDNGEVVDPAPAGSGLINTELAVSFDGAARPVVGYHAYDVNGNSQILAARLEDGAWTVRQLSDFTCRWDFTIPGDTGVNVEPMTVEAPGVLGAEYTACDGSGAVWKIDEETLTVVGTLAPRDATPHELPRFEPTTTSICGYSDVGRRTVLAHGSDPAVARYFLRWFSLGPNGDQSRANCTSAATSLRSYALN